MFFNNQPYNELDVDLLKKRYPEGTRIMLEHMGEDLAPILPGTRGTVDYVDDIGTIHILWDNGRTLGIIPDVDSFRKLTTEELNLEKISIEPEQEVKER